MLNNHINKLINKSLALGYWKTYTIPSNELLIFKTLESFWKDILYHYPDNSIKLKIVVRRGGYYKNITKVMTVNYNDASILLDNLAQRSNFEYNIDAIIINYHIMNRRYDSNLAPFK